MIVETFFCNLGRITSVACHFNVWRENFLKTHWPLYCNGLDTKLSFLQLRACTQLDSKINKIFHHTHRTLLFEINYEFRTCATMDKTIWKS